MYSKIALATTMLVGESAASWWLFGEDCPFVRDVKDFDIKKFGGPWHEVFRDMDADWWFGRTCVSRNYHVDGDGQMTIDFKYAYYGDNVEIIDEGYSWTYGLLDTGDWILGQVENRIVATDYDNYALTYGCKTIFGFVHIDYSTLLSREKKIQKRYVDTAREILAT